MVSTRFKRIDYKVNFLDVARPVKGTQDPISKNYAHLDVIEKLITQIQTNRQMCTGFQLISQKNDSSEKC